MSEQTNEETREDQILQNEATRMSVLAGSEDWKLAKTKLVEKINSLTSILDMDEALLGNEAELKGRKHAANLIGQWIAEVEGQLLLHDKIEETKNDQPHVLRIG